MSLRSDRPVPVTDVLHVTEDGELVHPADFGRRAFATLEDVGHEPIDFERTVAALQSALWKIDYPVFSSWGTHVPFLFSLMSVLEPRSYVELGVQGGASFFAACQAVERLGTETTCVAIDNWVGDYHAGQSASGEFDAVRGRIAERYSEFAGYMRGDFAEAVGQFQSGSIDLLHVDGLHTTAAVAKDFDTWFERLSSRGVVMFHDINEFKDDFGVWRFWRRVRERYPHVEFGHGHGLGVLVVGEKSPLHHLHGDWSGSVFSPEAGELLQVLFGGIGQLSWTLARETNKPRPSGADANEVKRLKQQLVAKESTVKELSRRPLPDQLKSRDARIEELESRIKKLESRVRAFETSTSWRLTAPVRFVGRRARRLRR